MRLTQVALILAAVVAGPTPLVYASAPPASCGHSGPATPIYASDPTWKPEIQGGATVGITGTNPRSGNGSLDLTASGNLADWGFYRRDAGSGGFGLLSAMDCLSFDWFRETLITPTDKPWSAQTPVLRLYVWDPIANTENQLVWEAYYNNGGTPTVNDAWHTENLVDQSFWRFLPGQGAGVGQCALGNALDPNNVLTTMAVSGWASTCFSSNAFISAISVGVGSYWPYQYHGFVDNVQLGFRGQDGYAVNDNFEVAPVTTTPEPASMVLMSTGLATMMAAGWVRRRRAGAADRN